DARPSPDRLACSCSAVRLFLGVVEARQIHIAGARDLDVALAAEHDADFDLIETLDETGFVGAGEIIALRGFDGAAENFTAEDLRGLRENETLARNGATDFRATGLRSAHLLDCVDGNDADDGGAVGIGFFDDFTNRFEIDKRPHRIVNRDDIDRGIERGERVLDRFLASVAALHYFEMAEQALRFGLEHFVSTRDVFFSNGDDDV